MLVGGDAHETHDILTGQHTGVTLRNDLGFAEPLLELAGIGLTQCVLAITDLNRLLFRLAADLITSATVLDRCVVIQDHHHAHAGDGIAVIPGIDHAGLKVVGVAECLAVDATHLRAGAENVVETLDVDVTTQARLGQGHLAVFFGDVEVDPVFDARLCVFQSLGLCATNARAVLAA